MTHRGNGAMSMQEFDREIDKLGVGKLQQEEKEVTGSIEKKEK